MKFKYILADVDCEYCLNRKNPFCIIKVCPHIMANLSDLFADSKFREAVKDAENCAAPHKYTLMRLKKQAIERGYDLFYEERVSRCDYKTRCKSCIHAAPGLVCYNRKDGTCIYDWLRVLENAGC